VHDTSVSGTPTALSCTGESQRTCPMGRPTDQSCSVDKVLSMLQVMYIHQTHAYLVKAAYE